MDTIEAQHARAVERQLVALLDKARTVVLEQVELLVAALEDADGFLNDAHTLARNFNLEEGRTRCFDEEFCLRLDNNTSQWGEEFLSTTLVQIVGETAPKPGVRVQLFAHVPLRDYPKNTAVVLPHGQADRLVWEGCAGRLCQQRSGTAGEAVNFASDGGLDNEN